MIPSMLETINTPVLDLACLALLKRPAQGIVYSSLELGARMYPRRAMAPLGAVLDEALDILDADGAVSIHFPRVGSW